ncbi:hypothetical protein AB7645_05560 [Bradyrhizobium sp. 956_D2_N1_5]|uniref:hypothetical protein n=1 Tax=unclassified Bradyrhizobium TaxID=2631580 RepID=UPI003F297E31
MKKPPAMGTPEASIDNHNNSTAIVVDRETSAQASKPQPTEIAHVGAIWKSARDRTRCLQFDIKELNGHAYLDCRTYKLDGNGRMQPTDQRLTIGTKQLAKLADMIGKSYRKAHQLGLTAGSSS